MPAAYIASMNQALAAEDDRLTAAFVTPTHPVSFLIGLPRTGKTLFHQAVATALDIGYVSNLLNKFWRAPYLGACLERDVLQEAPESSFRSRYGNTSGAGEPGEWGWFWRHWLGLADGQHHLTPGADLSALASKLAALETAKGKPLFFNNMYAVSNLNLLDDLLEKLLVIDKPRDPYWICSSVINARVKRHGDVAAHFANLPRTNDALPAVSDPVEQVVLQVRALLDEMAAIRRLVGPENVFVVDFQRFLADPKAELDALREFWLGHGVRAEWTGRALPERFDDRNDPGLIDPTYRDRLNRAFVRHFGEPALPALVA